MNLKKMLAILLAAIMLLSLIPLTALAEGDEPNEDPAYTHPTEPEEPSTDPVDVGDPAEDPAEDPAQAGEELDNPRNLEGDEPGNEPVEEPIDVTSVTIDQPAQELTVGQFVQLTVTIEPAEATEQSITWQSEDETVVTVDGNGLVTAVGAGENVTVTAHASSGVSGTCLFTVTAEEPTTPEVPQEPESVEGYYLSGSFNSWAVQDAYQLTLNPANENEYMRQNVYLEADAAVKGVKAENGAITTYYPGLNNEPNYQIPATGYYDVFLRPNGGGDGAWYYNCLLLAPVMRNITYTAVENGEVTGPATAQVGSTVTVTATPADGYKLAYLDVTDADEAAVTVTGNTFVMPAKDVTVSATFVASGSTTYALWEEDSKTLSLYYGVAPEDAVATGFGFSHGIFSPFDSHYSATSESYTNATSVVFDSSFQNARPTDLNYWFHLFYDLTTISGIQYLNTSNVTKMDYMFYSCENLTALDVTKFDTSNVTSMYNTFGFCGSLTTLDVTKFNTANVTNMCGMFQGCSGLTSLDVTHFDTRKVTDMSSMFSQCYGLTELDVTNFKTENVTKMFYMFNRCYNLTSLDVTHFNTSNVTDMSLMFCGCSGLTSLDVTHFDTGKVTSMNSMFSFCGGLTSLDVSHFDTSKVTDMIEMFYCSDGLTELDLKNFNTGSVTRMERMFYLCQNLITVDVSSFNTEKVINMEGMFGGCPKLTALDISSFDTGNVTNMEKMFGNCSSLTVLDLSGFNTSSVTNMRSMFDGCRNLHTIFVDGTKWNTSSVSASNYCTEMFTSTGRLVGGAGTVTTHENRGKIEYARIDVPKDPNDPDSVAKPGYFTDIADKDRMNMGLSNDDVVLKQFYVDEIVTTADNVVYAKLPKNSYPRFSTTSYPKLLEEQYAGYIFAGYFDSIGERATASREATETTGYARFIPIEVLDVYVQFRRVSRATTNPESKTDLRFITSVPDTSTLGCQYKNEGVALIGFRLLNVTDGFTISDHAFGTQYCYDEITGSSYTVTKDGETFSLTPDRFYAGISAKVALQTVIGMPNTYFDNQKVLSVQPYIITLDGTYSYATVHPFQLKYAEDGSKTAVPVA